LVALERLTIGCLMPALVVALVAADAYRPMQILDEPSDKEAVPAKGGGCREEMNDNPCTTL